MVQEVGFNSICNAPGVDLCKSQSRPLQVVHCGGHVGDGPGCAACKFVIQSMGMYIHQHLKVMLDTVKRSVCDKRFPDPTKVRRRRTSGHTTQHMA